MVAMQHTARVVYIVWATVIEQWILHYHSCYPVEQSNVWQLPPLNSVVFPWATVAEQWVTMQHTARVVCNRPILWPTVVEQLVLHHHGFYARYHQSCTCAI